MIQCIENGSVNPSYEILFPIVNRLGLTTSDLFSIEPDQHKEEINHRKAGKQPAGKARPYPLAAIQPLRRPLR